jgi:hypothetical protein
MYNNKFVLSIIQDGHPVKETGNRWEKEIAIPFDSEYKIRLKNKNDRSCTARVFIDGKKVSQLGDVIVTAGGTIDLERYIDRSLKKGKRFKFVPANHPDVDDPTSSSNGIIKVEFRKAKQLNGIKIDCDWRDFDWTPPYKEDNDGPRAFGDGGFVGDPANDTVTYSASNNMSKGTMKCSSGGWEIMNSRKSFVSDGATVEGSKSNQQFSYSSLEVESYVTTLRLKMVGVGKRDVVRNSVYKYCSKCGNKVKRVDKYCSECGYRV